MQIQAKKLDFLKIGKKEEMRDIGLNYAAQDLKINIQSLVMKTNNLERFKTITEDTFFMSKESFISFHLSCLLLNAPRFCCSEIQSSH